MLLHNPNIRLGISFNTQIKHSQRSFISVGDTIVGHIRSERNIKVIITNHWNGVLIVTDEKEEFIENPGVINIGDNYRLNIASLQYRNFLGDLSKFREPTTSDLDETDINKLYYLLPPRTGHNFMLRERVALRVYDIDESQCDFLFMGDFSEPTKRIVMPSVIVPGERYIVFNGLVISKSNFLEHYMTHNGKYHNLINNMILYNSDHAFSILVEMYTILTRTLEVKGEMKKYILTTSDFSDILQNREKLIEYYTRVSGRNEKIVLGADFDQAIHVESEILSAADEDRLIPADLIDMQMEEDEKACIATETTYMSINAFLQEFGDSLASCNARIMGSSALFMLMSKIYENVPEKSIPIPGDIDIWVHSSTMSDMHSSISSKFILVDKKENHGWNNLSPNVVSISTYKSNRYKFEIQMIEINTTFERMLNQFDLSVAKVMWNPMLDPETRMPIGIQCDESVQEDIRNNRAVFCERPWDVGMSNTGGLDLRKRAISRILKYKEKGFEIIMSPKSRFTLEDVNKSQEKDNIMSSDVHNGFYVISPTENSQVNMIVNCVNTLHTLIDEHIRPKVSEKLNRTLRYFVEESFKKYTQTKPGKYPLYEYVLNNKETCVRNINRYMNRRIRDTRQDVPSMLDCVEALEFFKIDFNISAYSELIQLFMFYLFELKKKEEVLIYNKSVDLSIT